MERREVGMPRAGVFAHEHEVEVGVDQASLQQLAVGHVDVQPHLGMRLQNARQQRGGQRIAQRGPHADAHDAPVALSRQFDLAREVRHVP